MISLPYLLSPLLCWPSGPCWIPITSIMKMPTTLQKCVFYQLLPLPWAAAPAFQQHMHGVQLVHSHLKSSIPIPLFHSGHKIVATITQIYLHPTILATLCTIIDFCSTNLSSLDLTCHIVSVATWADRYKSNMTWSAHVIWSWWAHARSYYLIFVFLSCL